MKTLILVAMLPALLCGRLSAEGMNRIEGACPSTGLCVTNLSGFSISCYLNTNAYAGGDRLVLTCAVTNTSSSPVTIDTPHLDDSWSFNFTTRGSSSSGPFPPSLPTPCTNTLRCGEEILVAKEYVVPEVISFQTWREAVRAAKDNRAEHHSRFVPQAMSEEEFAVFAMKALPTNIPPAFSFETVLCLPLVTCTTTYTFVEVVLTNIPIRITKVAEPTFAGDVLKAAPKE